MDTRKHRLKLALAARGKRMGDLADALRVDLAYLSAWAGGRRLSTVKVTEIAAVLSGWDIVCRGGPVHVPPEALEPGSSPFPLAG